ncbi:MAG: formate dehydrogenase subunit delta [Candidatus Protistobacter heckmanni]|nr:formate dehydrogenase subunit delta [Candidatus Protistobacter heckmanni]
MDIEHLVKMANQIGTFYAAMPDRKQAEADIASHLQRFWEPRMREAFLAHIDACKASSADSGLLLIVAEMVSVHGSKLQPARQPS